MNAKLGILRPRSAAVSTGRAALVLVAFALLLTGVAQPAVAETTTHVFDATLSLSGDCNTFPGLDEIPDPGLCPMPPGVAGVDHPSAALSYPGHETTDEYGNLYVVSRGSEGEGGQSHGSDARVDIFDSSGHFLTGVDSVGAAVAAVDSEGHLYVYDERGAPSVPAQVVRYDPTLYNPAAGEIVYGGAPVLVVDEAQVINFNSIALDGAGRLYVYLGGAINEYGSATEGNMFIAAIGQGVLDGGVWMAIDRSTGKLYASDSNGANPSVIRVFDLKDSSHPLMETIDGSTTPAGDFGDNKISLGVEEGNHHIFVDERQTSAAAKPVYELTETGEYVAKVEHKFAYVSPVSGIAIDNGAHSPNTGYLFVPSGFSEHGHLYAFAPVNSGPPEVDALPPSGVSSDEALLRATINPNGAATHYSFEYTTQRRFEEEEFSGATVAGEGELAAGKEAVEVSAPATGLTPGTAYRFRILATNSCQLGCGSDENEGAFATYPEAPPQDTPCANEAFRGGLAGALPDCRAYELVSPPSSNGHPLLSIDSNVSNGTAFGIPTASPDGEAVGFIALGGAIPGLGGSGNAEGDVYVARRGEGGWRTHSVGPTGEQATIAVQLGLSPDQEYAGFKADHAGSLVTSSQGASYIRYPDGSYKLIGRGSLGDDPVALPLLITDGAAHVVFRGGNQGTQPRLEPDAPPLGTQAIYDRTADEQTHVVSLLPGDVTPAAGEHASFKGASRDGRGVVFAIGGVLYERLDNAETFEVAGAAAFAGISGGGGRVLYLKGGDLYAFEAAGAQTTRLTESGDVTPVNLSTDGSHVYFVSPSVLDPEANSAGEAAQPGSENLYVWAAGAIRFIATVTERDVVGEADGTGVERDGLGLWLAALERGGAFAMDPSRATANGSVFLFSSRRDLSDYEAAGKAEIYRYDAGSAELRCISCSPAKLPPNGDSNLQSVPFAAESGLAPTGSPVGPRALIPNLSPDGRRVFFESPDPLVAADTDQLQDVYQWEAQGRGSCAAPGGCVSLISSGQSVASNYLYGASTSGDDVFFRTSDLLVEADKDETPSIYDARVGGGFAQASGREECLGEACQPAAVAPTDPGLASASFRGAGNVPPKANRRCPRGRHRARRGKKRCVATQRHKHNRRNAR